MIGEACFLVAEIGINHNGDLGTALELIEAASDAGADAVKFQVGDPKRYVNRDRWEVPRETPWGVVPYIEYRKRMELSDAELAQTRDAALARGLVWFASPLDTSAIVRLEGLDCPAYKVASPMLTDAPLLGALRASRKPVLMSSGMSTPDEIRKAYDAVQPVAVLHCTSAYPCPPELVNLSMIHTLAGWFPHAVIGFSDHSVGIPQSVAAVAMGAKVVERHLTLSRAMWGSDHAASLEPQGFAKMAGYIRTVEASMGDGVKRVYDAERANMDKFRA